MREVWTRNNCSHASHFLVFSAPKVIIASIYKNLREKMKLLWNRDLKMNTVHVLDVCRAIWHLYLHGQRGHIYNLADKSETSQSEQVECQFNMRHGHTNTVQCLHMPDL